MRASVLKSLPAIVMILALSSGSTGFSQDHMALGSRQFEFDKSGKGAVLCVWSIYLSLQAAAKTCQMPRRPVDDAIDQAIIQMDDFIIANSSLHPTRAALEDFKRRAAAQAQSQKGFCEGPAIRDFDVFRRMTPEQVQKSIADLLAAPREPVMNPCL